MCSEYILQYFVVERNVTLHFWISFSENHFLCIQVDLIFLKLNLFAYLVCNGKRLEEIVAFPMNGTKANDQVICMSLFHSDSSSDRNACFDSLTKIVILVQRFFFFSWKKIMHSKV